MKPIRISASNNISGSQLRTNPVSLEDKFHIMRLFMGIETERLNNQLREKTKEIENLTKDIFRNQTELSKQELLEKEL